MDVTLWLTEMARLLNELKEVDIGYPQGSNMLYPPTKEGLEKLLFKTSTPLSLVIFYQSCGGLDLEDLSNGYFIHSPEIILQGLESGEPTSISGRYAGPIIVFGSDGGGGRFSLRLEENDSEVLYLPSSGSVYSSVYNGEQNSVQIKCGNFNSFLEILKADLSHYIHN